ncbi:hypothetical protein PLICRDRAFT_549398 [Plicaturopsis crispa FD-325 SS-3]|nr:hypothetical protein PLICRDRAFT_549398 [Plicaturopsis crispa FD-325 SS-3]
MPAGQKYEHKLIVRQQPKHARVCAISGDCRPVDPPPIIQLQVLNPGANSQQLHSAQERPRVCSPSPSLPSFDTILDPFCSELNEPYPVSNNSACPQSQYYFMFASLVKAETSTELLYLKDGKTPSTSGSLVSSLYHLTVSASFFMLSLSLRSCDVDNNENADFFVFPDLSVRIEGSFRLKLCLYELDGESVRNHDSVYTAPFSVYPAKRYPGMEESTALSCCLADQGIKIRIRKDARPQKRAIPDSSNSSSDYNDNLMSSGSTSRTQNGYNNHKGAAARACGFLYFASAPRYGLDTRRRPPSRRWQQRKSTAVVV